MVSIKTFYLRDLQEDSLSLFDAYLDPQKFIPKDVAPWVEVLNANPYADPSDPVLVLALHGQEVVGRLGMFPAEMMLGELYRSFLLSGFFMVGAARETGAAGIVMLQAMRRCRSAIANGGPSEGARRVLESAGLQELPRLRRYVYFYRARPVIGWLLKNRWQRLHSALGIGAKPLLSSYYTLKRPNRSTRQLEFRPAEQFDSNLDRLPASAPNGFRRSSAFLNWALGQRRSLRAFTIHRHRGLAGYLILNTLQLEETAEQNLPAMRVGELLDVRIADGRERDDMELVSFIIDYYQGLSVDVLQIQASTPSLAAACRRHGMLCKGGNRIHFKPPPGLQAGFDPSSWHYTAGEGDVLLTG